MDISESKYSLKHSGSMSVYFLDAIEATLRHTTWERWNLLDTDDARVCDDEKIKFIIDPVEKDKCQECYPVYRHARPIDSLISDNVNNDELIIEKYPRRNDKGEKVEKVVDEYYPMSMESHDDLLVVFEEGNMFFFDHVMCGSLR